MAIPVFTSWITVLYVQNSNESNTIGTYRVVLPSQLTQVMTRGTARLMVSKQLVAGYEQSLGIVITHYTSSYRRPLTVGFKSSKKTQLSKQWPTSINRYQPLQPLPTITKKILKQIYTVNGLTHPRNFQLHIHPQVWDIREIS